MDQRQGLEQKLANLRATRANTPQHEAVLHADIADIERQLRDGRTDAEKVEAWKAELAAERAKIEDSLPYAIRDYSAELHDSFTHGMRVAQRRMNDLVHRIRQHEPSFQFVEPSWTELSRQLDDRRAQAAADEERNRAELPEKKSRWGRMTGRRSSR